MNKLHHYRIYIPMLDLSKMQSLSSDEQIEFTKQIMLMLDNWGVSHENKILLLALPSEFKTRMVRRFYIDRPLPITEQVMQRLDHLMGIADAMRTSYPLNAQMTAYWLNKKNHRFEDKTPLDYMLQGGTKNVIAIRAHLDCAWDWKQDDLNEK